MNTEDFSPKRLRAARITLALSNEDLSKLFKVSPNAISQWQTGKSKPRDKETRLKVAEWVAEVEREHGDLLGRLFTHARVWGWRGNKMEPQRLRFARLHAGLTAREAAAIFDVSWAHYVKWERGQMQPRPYNASRINAWIKKVEKDYGLLVPLTYSYEDARRIRKDAGLSIRQFAAALNLPTRTIMLWERLSGEIRGPANLYQCVKKLREIEKGIIRYDLPGEAKGQSSLEILSQFKEIVKDKGVSTVVLAKQLRANYWTVRRWLAGKNLPMKQAYINAISEWVEKRGSQIIKELEPTRLEEARTRRGLTLAELGNKFGVSSMKMYMWEKLGYPEAIESELEKWIEETENAETLSGRELSDLRLKLGATRRGLSDYLGITVNKLQALERADMIPVNDETQPILVKIFALVEGRAKLDGVVTVEQVATFKDLVVSEDRALKLVAEEMGVQVSKLYRWKNSMARPKKEKDINRFKDWLKMKMFGSLQTKDDATKDVSDH